MPPSTTESMLAIVMTAGEEFPGNAGLAEAIKARIPNIVIPSEIVADPKGALVFLYEDYMFAVGKVDAPCPISKDDPCVQFAWYWPDAWDAVSKHKAHLLPSVSGGADAKRRAALHGQLVAAVVDAAKDAVAVHWASSDSLWPAPLVAQSIAPGEQKPPMPFCVAIKLSRDADGGVSGATRGLAMRSDHSPEPGADDRDVAIASGLADHPVKGVATAILASASIPDLTLLIANEPRQG